jgi:hypothetical protein
MKKTHAYVEDVLVATEENVVKPQRSQRTQRFFPMEFIPFFISVVSVIQSFNFLFFLSVSHFAVSVSLL